MKHANKKYKDRLFHFLFGREEHKEWTLSLYNAVRGSGYTNINDIQFNTIENVLYLGMHNDISFLIMGELNLYEQQSSFNPNMPLRMLQYTAKVLEKYVKQNHLDKYGSHILELPVPKLVVFYNGAADKPDEMILSLRDSLPSDADPDIDVRVRMININTNHSAALLKACRPLWEYSWIIRRIRENRSVLSLYDAINKTIDEMPESFLIRDLLLSHRSEVSEMLETEYNEEEVLKVVAEAAEKRGFKLGEESGFKLGEEHGRNRFATLLKKLNPGSEEFNQALNAAPELLEQLYKKYNITED